MSPDICSNGKPPVTPPNQCCPICPIDCALVDCAPPTVYCKKGQIPLSDGKCCPICKLNCTAVQCLACKKGQVATRHPNSCCPICKPLDC